MPCPRRTFAVPLAFRYRRWPEHQLLCNDTDANCTNISTFTAMSPVRDHRLPGSNTALSIPPWHGLAGLGPGTARPQHPRTRNRRTDIPPALPHAFGTGEPMAGRHLHIRGPIRVAIATRAARDGRLQRVRGNSVELQSKSHAEKT